MTDTLVRRASRRNARRNARFTPLAVDGPLPADMLRDVAAIRRDPLRYLERTVDRYGDLVAFPLPRTPVLLVNTPDGARACSRTTTAATASEPCSTPRSGS